MDIKIVCAGKMKEKYYKEACDEYIKMLGRFCKVSVIEIPDEPLSLVKSEADEIKSLEKEAEKISKRLEGYVIVLDVKGKRMTSEGFSSAIKNVMTGGDSTITFVIGSSLGLHDSIRQKAHLRLSFSDMTLPHRLFRVVLLEQIFRAFKIMNGEAYHK